MVSKINILFKDNRNELETFWTINKGGAIKQIGDEIMLSGEPFTIHHDFYPESCLMDCNMELDFVPSRGPIYVDASPFYIVLDDEHHFSAISRTVGGNYLAHSDQLRIVAGQRNTLKLVYKSGRLEVKLNGESLVFSSEYTPTINNIALTGFGEIRISNLMVTGNSELLVSFSEAKTFNFDMTFDFVDDILPAPYSKDMLSQMMATLKANGFRRVNWIYWGGRAAGFWTSIADGIIPAKNLYKAFEYLGDDFLPFAVEAAHQAGLEIYAIFKPFDMSICGLNMPVGSEAKFPFIRNHVLGGQAYACYDFPAKHPELCMRRKKTVKKQSISKITITTRNISAALSGEIIIWTSKDNWTYKIYEGPRNIVCSGKQITISGLNIIAPYIALQLKDETDQKSIFNTLADLITVYDVQGEAIPFTYGLTPRTYSRFSTNHLESQIDKGGGFCEEGLLFDSQQGIPSAVWNAEEVSHRYFDFRANEEGVIGITSGQNDFVPGCMSPAEPEAMKYWLKIIQQALNHGVDGIDLRVQSHCNVLSWSEYGFNDPIVAEYQKRFGVDVRSEKYDRKAWRELQGEYYTNFLKAAKQAVCVKGKKLQLHIEDMMEGLPDAPTPMNIDWDWQGWLEAGIPDEVTYKALYADSYRSYMGRTLINICHEKGIPIYYSPFIHTLLGQTAERWTNYIRDLKQSGMSGLIIYENATIFKSHPDGTIENLQPDLIRYIHQNSQDQIF
jgi:hypothetical protein